MVFARRWVFPLLVLAAWAWPPLARAEPAQAKRAFPAPVPDERPARPENRTRCSYLEPDITLARASYVSKGRLTAEERRARAKLHDASIERRTKLYGYVAGFGKKVWNPTPPARSARWAAFMGKRVRLHERIVPALGCVEEQIRELCTTTPYEPQGLSGLREKNTYHSNEVSNHLYGIAIDVDPTRNTCCGCVAPWPDHPLCKQKVASIFERMAMPACWVQAFERFGFYWLGRDELQDTMHFEFLADPAAIVRPDAPTVSPTAP